MSELKIGMVGFGRAAERLHFPALRRMPGVRVAVVAEPNHERREWIAARAPEVIVLESADALFEQADLSAVIVSSPPATHCEMTFAAIRRGVPALIEKPLATSAAQADALAALPAADKRLIAVGFNRRFWSPVIALRSAMRRNSKRPPAKAELTMHTNLRQWDPVAAESELLDDLFCHQTDLVRFLLEGDIESISAQWRAKQQIEVSLQLEEGIETVCRAGYSDTYDEEIKVEKDGCRFRIHAESDRIAPAYGLLRPLLDRGDRLRRRIYRKLPSLQLSYQHQLDHFIEDLLLKRSPCPGIDEGVSAVRAVVAARESANNDGKVVYL